MKGRSVMSRIIIMILSVILIGSTTVAMADTVPIDGTRGDVRVNGRTILVAESYFANGGDMLVSSNQLRLIKRELGETDDGGNFEITPMFSLRDFCQQRGYTYQVNSYNVGNSIVFYADITGDWNTIYPNSGETHVRLDEEIVFRNVSLTNGGDVMISGGNLKTVFPIEAADYVNTREYSLREFCQAHTFEYSILYTNDGWGNITYVDITAKPLIVVISDRGILSVTYGGELVNFTGQEPIIRNNRTMIPLRTLSEEMGYVVNWNSVKQEILVSNGLIEIILTVGSRDYTVNGVGKTMDIEPFVLNNSTMVPLRFIGEAFGHRLEWLSLT